MGLEIALPNGARNKVRERARLGQARDGDARVLAAAQVAPRAPQGAVGRVGEAAVFVGVATAVRLGRLVRQPRDVAAGWAGCLRNGESHLPGSRESPARKSAV